MDNNLSQWVWVDGHFIEKHEAKISIFDRGFLFGDGVFTTARVREGHVELWPLHEARLQAHCQALKLVYPAIHYSTIQELIIRNRAYTGYWRLKLIVTGGISPDLILRERKGSCILLLTPYAFKKWQPQRLTVYPEPIYHPHNSLKTLSYLSRLQVLDYAQQHGFDDAIVLSSTGSIMDTSFSNFFWFDGQTVYVPDSSSPYLQGVLLNYLLKVMEKEGINIQFVQKSLDDVISSNISFYTCNALKILTPVIEIKGLTFKRNSAFEELFENFCS